MTEDETKSQIKKGGKIFADGRFIYHWAPIFSSIILTNDLTETLLRRECTG
jgi:hypothetical protein